MPPDIFVDIQQALIPYTPNVLTAFALGVLVTLAILKIIKSF